MKKKKRFPPQVMRHFIKQVLAEANLMKHYRLDGGTDGCSKIMYTVKELMKMSNHRKASLHLSRIPMSGRLRNRLFANDCTDVVSVMTAGRVRVAKFRQMGPKLLEELDVLIGILGLTHSYNG